MKRVLNIVIFCGLIALLALANKEILGFSFDDQKAEGVDFDPKHQITQVLFSSELAPDVTGFGGPIPLVIGIDDHGVIKDVKFLKNAETPEFFKVVLDSGILSHWVGKDVPTAAEVEVDAVSGATMSSVGVAKTMKHSLNATLGKSVSSSSSLTQADWIKALSISVVGLLALVSFFAPRRTKPLHLTFVVASLVVLGMWHGSLLSVSKFSSWVLHGVPSVMEIPLFLIFVASILIPAFTGKNFYCYHLCPFGAAQDLMAKGVKVNLKIRLSKWLNHMRMVVLLSCFLLLFLGMGAEIANIEPFSAFKLEYAPLSALIIFGVALVISTFIPRAWCRYLCPCGAFLDLAKGIFKKGRTPKKLG